MIIEILIICGFIVFVIFMVYSAYLSYKSYCQMIDGINKAFEDFGKNLGRAIKEYYENEGKEYEK